MGAALAPHAARRASSAPASPGRSCVLLAGCLAVALASVRYSTTATPGAAAGYGAGWWINAGDSPGARFRREHGMPADAFMALGAQGQTVVVVPSRRLVVTYDGRL